MLLLIVSSCHLVIGMFYFLRVPNLIATRTAWQVSAILKFIPENKDIAARYGFYM
jgi:hypothetical protein